MARERELKLSAPPGFRIPPLDELGLHAAFEGEKRLVTTYFDTPDLRLARWHVTLRYRAGEGWTVKLPGSAAEGIMVRDEIEFGGPAAKPPAAALALLRGLLRHSDVVGVARLRTVRRVVGLVDLDGRRIAEVDDDEVSVIDGRRLAARFRQLEVELTSIGSNDVLEAVAGVFRAAGAIPDPVSKAARALGPQADAAPEVEPQPVPASAEAGAVVTAAIASATARLLRHDPGVRLGDDPEAVHQARVATRRLRADLRTFSRLLDPDWAAKLGGELRWLGGALGAVRDAEVLREHLARLADDLPGEDRAGALRVAGRLDSTRSAARSALLAHLASERYLELLETMIAGSNLSPLTELASAPASETMQAAVQAGWRRLRRAVGALAANPPDDDLHAVRILAKRLRYAAEAAGIALDGYAKLARNAAEVQDVLGRHQDAVLAQEWLREQRPSLSPTLAFAAGELWGLAGMQAREARAEWPGAWKRLRKRVRATL